MDDPDVAAFKLKFGVRLANKSKKVMYLPASTVGEGATIELALLGAQAKQSDGSWKYLLQASWYGTRDTKYQNCTAVSPGETGEIGAVDSELVLMKEQLATLGHEPTVRLDLMVDCRRLDGEIAAIGLRTGEFKLKLPAPPQMR
jgi:hypothetical protein